MTDSKHEREALKMAMEYLKDVREALLLANSPLGNTPLLQTMRSRLVEDIDTFSAQVYERVGGLDD